MAVRIGVVGAGGMAAYHIPGFRAGGAEVVALADVNLPAAQAAAEKFGIGKVASGSVHRGLVVVSLASGREYREGGIGSGGSKFDIRECASGSGSSKIGIGMRAAQQAVGSWHRAVVSS